MPSVPEIPAHYLLSADAPSPRTLIDILNEIATRYPDAAALDDGTVQLTYSELISDIEASVQWLAARGIGRGDRIGIRMGRLGDERFFALLKDWATRHRHSTVVTGDFTGLAANYSSESLQPLWSAWLFSTQVP